MSPADDTSFRAPHDLDKTARIDTAEIAGAEPAFIEGFFGLALIKVSHEEDRGPRTKKFGLGNRNSAALTAPHQFVIGVRYRYSDS